MALRRIPAKTTVAATVIKGRVARAPDAHDKATGERKDATVTVRMTPSHKHMLEESMRLMECDKTEVIKRGIRVVHGIMGCDECVIKGTHKDGTPYLIQYIKNGHVVV